MTPPNSLGSIKAKIHRAEQHIENLKTELRAFLDTNPYRGVGYDDPKTGDRVIKLHVVVECPSPVLLALGDAIHNLRSSLDYLAWQLCLASGGRPNDNTGFPIVYDGSKIEAEIARKIPGASAEVIAAIKILEPYKGGKLDVLWRLHRLDIIDKHRLLIAVATCSHWIDARYKRWEPEWLFPQAPRPLKGLPPRGLALEHGTELLRVPRAEYQQATMDVNVEFKFQVAFGEIFEGLPIVPILEDSLLKIVRQIADGFTLRLK